MCAFLSIFGLERIFGVGATCIAIYAAKAVLKGLFTCIFIHQQQRGYKIKEIS
jgi:hypothetical protein